MRIKNQPLPLSAIAEKSIIHYIKTNNIQVDEKLPTEVELMDLLGVSRYTIREALAVLTEKQIIYKIQGRGTFLKKKPMEISSGLEKLESISESIERYGFTADTRWVSMEENAPTESMVKKLKINPDQPVTTFKRVKMADDKVALFCVDTVPSHMLNKELLQDLGNKSLFSLLEENGIIITSSLAEVLPSFPTEEMKQILGVEDNHLFVLLYQIHYDREGIPVSYSKDYFDPAVIKFQINRLR